MLVSSVASVSDAERGSPARRKAAEGVFTVSLGFSAAFSGAIILIMVASLAIASWPALRGHALELIAGRDWNPDALSFGGLPFIVGSVLTSLLALLISLPFSVAIAIFLGEFRSKGKIRSFLASAIDLLAGIPSIIYGAWGLFVLVPLVQKIELPLASRGVLPLGVGILSASLLLAIMIIPYSASLSREVVSLVPGDLKEAAYALGGTRLAVIKRVSLPWSFSGIIAGELLAFGRALGETMAVAMVIGNMNEIPRNLFSPGATIASLIANEFAESSGLHISALTGMGLALFAITVAFSLAGRLAIQAVAGRSKA